MDNSGDVSISFILWASTPYVLSGAESFQLQMGFSFPFLQANYLRSSLLIMRTRSFLLSCR